MPASAAETQLARSLAEFLPEVMSVAVAARAKMRARLPGAIELVYDSYEALSIGFGPNERLSDTIFSLALYPRWVNLFFLQGAALDDPDKILKGSGSMMRHVVLQTAATLDEPQIEAMIARALQAAPTPLDPAQPHRLVIKSVAQNRRPRLPSVPSLKTRIPKARAVKKRP